MIYVLDTNVLSEVMRDTPHPGVVTWLRSCPPAAMRTTAVTQAEIFYGIGLLAQSEKQRRLERAAQTMFAQEFFEKILPFDSRSAVLYSQLRISRRKAGRPISQEDGMIAAIASAHGAVVVTRDIGGFAECGVPLIDPWAS